MAATLFHQTFTPRRCQSIVSSHVLIPFLITLPSFVIFPGYPFPPMGIRKKESPRRLYAQGVSRSHVYLCRIIDILKGARPLFR